MKEEKANLLEQLERMKEGAEDLQRQGIKYYAMHAECAVKFATEAIELLAETEDLEPGEVFMSHLHTFNRTRIDSLFNEGWFNELAIGYAKIALENMGRKNSEFLARFEQAMKDAFDLYTVDAARKIYNRIEGGGAK
ncbi:MAG: hypothetical protein IJF39_03900 [Clostridia bacterium]|nr:hypothetical protein [Clostridia bacterium]